MKKLWVILGLFGALWGGELQHDIHIPALGPYFKEYEPRIQKRDPIALMELYLDAREHAGCIVFDEQTKVNIRKKVEALAEGGNAYAIYLMAGATAGKYSGTNPWYQRAADAGDPYGQLWFGGHVRNVQALSKTKNEFPNIDGMAYIQKAYTTFKNREEQGDRRAMFQLWATGYGSKKEKGERETKLFQGKDRIAYQAMYYKASIYLDPDVINQKEEILKLVHESAEGGDIEAMQFLKFYYYEGHCPREGYDPKRPKRRNLPKAWEWASRKWQAMGCLGEMPAWNTIDMYGEPWLKPGETKKPKPKPALKLPERTAPERH